MQTCNRLRIDRGDGSPAIDYRVIEGRVECRVVDSEEGWRQLAPQELTSLVKTKGVLAHWLSRRMGVFPLVRACNPESAIPDYSEEAA